MLELLRRAGACRGPRRSPAAAPRLRRYEQLLSTGRRLRRRHPRERATLGLAAELGESAVAESNYNLGMACRAAGDFHRAIAALATTARLPLTEYRGPAILAVHARAWLGTVLAEIGEFGEAIDEGEQGRRIAEALGNPFSHMTALHGLGVVYLAKGEFDSALPLLEHADALQGRDLSPSVRTGGLGTRRHLCGKCGCACRDRSPRTGPGTRACEKAARQLLSSSLQTGRGVSRRKPDG